MTPTKCQATNQDGTPCGAYPIADSQYCFHHDPDRAAERRQSRRKGGYARHGRKIPAPGASAAAQPIVLETMADVADLLQATINDALQLENSIRRARTVGYLAGLLLKALDIATLEERVTQVEHVLQSRDHVK
jgi:alkanesulfonate monooxygenase SsuD/methylene tetrahydromethanopterin reductase-like flavin-dependent oxidoreductase (luciferase family)